MTLHSFVKAIQDKSWETVQVFALTDGFLLSLVSVTFQGFAALGDSQQDFSWETFGDQVKVHQNIFKSQGITKSFGFLVYIWKHHIKVFEEERRGDF